jgi:ABC-2 type transport system permease protein
MPTYLRLEVLRMLRDRRYLIMTVAMPVALYLLFSNVFGGGAPVNGLTVDAGTMVAMAAFGAMGAVLAASGPRIAQERGSGWLRQLRATPFPPGQMLAAKVLAAMTLGLPAVVLVAATSVAVNGVRVSAWRLAAMAGLLWLGAAPFAALGVLIGRLTDGDSAYGLTSGIWFALAAPSGMWMPVDILPSTLRTIGGALPSSHYAQLGWRVAAGGGPALADALVLAAWTAGLALLVVLVTRRAAA